MLWDSCDSFAVWWLFVEHVLAVFGLFLLNWLFGGFVLLAVGLWFDLRVLLVLSAGLGVVVLVVIAFISLPVRLLDGLRWLCLLGCDLRV